MAQDDKKNLSVAVDVSGTINHIMVFMVYHIMVFMVHLCKMMISLGFFFSSFQNFHSFGC